MNIFTNKRLTFNKYEYVEYEWNIVSEYLYTIRCKFVRFSFRFNYAYNKLIYGYRYTYA